jgi:hypothetical protein
VEETALRAVVAEMSELKTSTLRQRKTFGGCVNMKEAVPKAKRCPVTGLCVPEHNISGMGCATEQTWSLV